MGIVGISQYYEPFSDFELIDCITNKKFDDH